MNKKKIKEIVDEVMEAESVPAVEEPIVVAEPMPEESILPAEEEVVIDEIIEDDVLVEDRPPVEPLKFKIGNEVKLVPGATYDSGIAIPDSIINSKLYVRQIKNGNYLIGLQMTGRILGSVKPENVIAYSAPMPVATDAIKPYLVFIQEDHLDLKSRPDVNAKTLKVLSKDGAFTVVDERDGWGHLKIGGWIPLDKTLRP